MTLFDYDAELRRYNSRLRAAADVRAGDRVLDIGCGTGQTSREAALVAVEVLGVDITARMLDEAERVGAGEGLSHLTFALADAQSYPFPPARFDLCISRFGTMFFADPVAAFTNIARALHRSARLVMLVWQGYERNAWATEILPVLGASPFLGSPGPFSLAEPDVTENILVAAGFTDVRFIDVAEPVYYGPDVAAAFDNLLRLSYFQTNLAALDDAAADRARGRLRAVLAAHETDDGVWFDSRSWIVTARR
ncbi:class I SAM-dependent methyltransferase [Nocardia sp. AG03]|uniref:class I SAM-dependent methyltransferase n=1 Tax=Nocardia sp. AG03 TaxID=3025312 RepID=UPI0024189780|nr:class I SAM-dependent methyltransferase [Nocardia sp. AG03]